MMRGPRFFAVACRRADGEVVEVCENVEGALRKWQWLHRPFLRGTLAIIDSMALGSKALRFSANVAVVDAMAADAKADARAPGVPDPRGAGARVDAGGV